MADWTANSNFGAIGARREPTFHANREGVPRSEAFRAERFAPAESIPASAALAEYNASQGGPLAKARLAVWAGGGLLSLALVAGIGVWGYRLVLREVLGLPVVVAEEGPMRVVPADPGGEVVPQQGLAVNAIPAAGTAAPPSDVLTLAPATPGLAEEDMEVVQTMAEAGEVMPAGTEPAPAVAAEPPAAPLAAATPPADHAMTADEVLAYADRIAAEAEPLTPLAPAPGPAPATAAVETAALAPAPVVPEASAIEAAPDASLVLEPPPEADPAPEAAAPAAPVALVPAGTPGVATASRPPARPAVSAAAPAAPVETVAAPAQASALDAAPAAEAPTEEHVEAAAGVALTAGLPSGTHLIQLGAFDSPEIAASEWERLQGRFDEFLGGRERVIQETQSGGRTLYRLRAQGFEDRAAARRLCAALMAEGADCIPVTVD